MIGKKKDRIMLISCYIGKFPEYFSLWLHSCGKNSTIDFLVVTDQEKPDWHPQNVYFLKTNIKELENRFQKKIDFKINLKHPYKLCDFRPLYGLAFQNELKGYDFWGHCDIDVIWGNIRKYLNNELLSSFDRIGKFGHFSIYRNINRINQAFTLSGSIFDYKKVFSSNLNYAFDEISGMNLICKENNITFYEGIKLVDAAYSYSRIRLIENDYPYELFYWLDGACFRSYVIEEEVLTEEFMYIHFQKKKLYNYIDFPESTKSFSIRSEGFYEIQNKIPNKDNIMEWCDYKGSKFEKKEQIQYKWKTIKSLFSKNWKEKHIWFKQQLALKEYDR